MVQTTRTINVVGDKDEFHPKNWTKEALNGHASGEPLPERHPDTGIDILIVGAGIGGLTTALECWRKGHNVVGILDRQEGPIYSGDILVMQPSAVSVLRHWPEMKHEMDRDQIDASISYQKHSGEHVYGPVVPAFNDPEAVDRRKGVFVAPAQLRITFFRMLLRQVAKLGFCVEYSKYAKSYFEDEAAGKAGVVLDDGEIRLADLVVAADGVKSHADKLITGIANPQPPKSSGMSIYRTAYPRKLAMQDDLVRERWGNSEAVWEYWMGPSMYMGVFFTPDTVAWAFTPKDTDGEPIESWDPDTSAEHVIHGMMKAPKKDWAPVISALVHTAPEGSIVHWPLLWRNLRREWTSPGGRVVQVGDAAHTFTATSGNGATQAFEDAITLASCLQLGGGSRNAGLAAKVFNLLRYQRVSCAQKMSFVNSQLKQETVWDQIQKDPSKARTRFPKWIYEHDPEAYAYEKYGQAFSHLVAGTEFQNTNYPPGHKFVSWTMEDVHEAFKAGQRVEDTLDGDWS